MARARLVDQHLRFGILYLLLGYFIVWDEPKRLANLDKHDLDFASLDMEFFASSTVMSAAHGRFKAIGWLGDGVVAVVIFAMLGQEAVSIISLRRASRTERALLHDKAQV